MKITFTADQHLLAKNLCFTARSLQIHAYQPDDFAVVSQNDSKKPFLVVFPDVRYSQQFWKSLTHLRNYSLGEEYPVVAMKEATRIVQGMNIKISPSQMNEWKSVVEEFIKKLEQILAKNIFEEITDIEVVMTPFGTAGSFSKVPLKKNKYKLLCLARTDLTANNCCSIILKGIISCLQPGYSGLGTKAYFERNAIVDFFRDHSQLSPYLTQLASAQITAEEKESSQQYLQKLGVSPLNNFNAQIFLDKLSLQEKKVFSCLWENAGILVSFETMATIIWEEQVDQKFSPYAMAKLIESIRKKLENFGIYKEMIFTVRKQGYLLQK